MRQLSPTSVRLLVFVLSAVVLAGCGPRPAPGSPEARARLSPLDRERAKLAEARTRWQRGNVTGYSYTLRRRCFCPPPASDPIQVTVRGGQPSATLVGRGTAAPADPFARYDTAEELFALADSAIARRPDLIVATYDPALGFPLSLTVDPDEDVNDEEYGFFISDFRRTP